MAEIGIAAAALQIADTVLKVKRVWNDIKDIPEELNDLLEGVSLQAEQLSTLYQQSSILPSATEYNGWHKRLASLEDCAGSLQELLDDLNNTLKNHSFTGSLRLYLRKTEIARCEKRLRNAQACLQFALGSELGTHYMLLYMPPILREIQQIRQDQQSNHPARLHSQSATIGVRARKNMSHRKVKSNKKKVGNQIKLAYTSHMVPLICFNIPLWTFRKCFQLLMNRTSEAWGFTLRVYNIRPKDSDLFTCARKGSWDAVRRMLTDRTASPFDVDEWGTTLLHLAAKQSNPKACGFLLRTGLHASIQRYYDDQTPLEAFSLAHRPIARHPHSTYSTLDARRQSFKKKHNKTGQLHESLYLHEPTKASSDETARLLLNSICNDRCEQKEGLKLWSRRCSLPSATVALLRDSLVTEYGKVDRLSRAVNALYTFAFDPQVVDVLLGNDISLLEALQLASGTSGPVYGHRQLLLNITHALARLNLRDERRLGWLKILTSLIKFESQISLTTRFRSACAQFIAFRMSSGNIGHVRSQGETWNDVLTSILREWLQILMDHGASLSRYGRAENICLKHPEIITWSDGHGRGHCYRFKYLFHGPKVEDWKIFVEPTIHVYPEEIRPRVKTFVVKGHLEYEMAGDFWHMIEHPEIFGVPGTYFTEEKLKSTGGKPVKVKGPIF